MKVRVLLHKARWGNGEWIDNLIGLWTRSKYSHVEIWTPEGSLFFKTVSQVLNPDDAGFCGTCWTSTMRDEDNGTVKRNASKVIENPESWDYIELDITRTQYDFLICLMEQEVSVNMGYAKKDLLKFAIPHLYKWLPSIFQDPERNICSEFVNNMLVLIGVLEGYGVEHPEGVKKKLVELGNKVKSL